MGDCRIRILISKSLLPKKSGGANNNDAKHDDGNSEWHVISHVESADSTLGDLNDAILQPIWYQETLPKDICLWDCTLNPPKDVTTWLTEFGQRTGQRSKTLYDCGWFPSGTLQVLPKGTTPSKTQNYDDVQYNLPSQSTLQQSVGGAVKLVENADMTPSQVLHSVTERFPKVNQEEELKRAIQVRKQRRKEARMKEAARHARLEERIQNLSSSKKSNKAVSQQVKRMLIKSRCIGSSSLKMHDRVYLHIVVVKGDDDTREDYRYFSQQDTVARIVATVAKVSLSQEAEMLIRQSAGSEEEEEVVYRRLPVAMRLYEAISEKYLEEVDAVVIRCFTPPDEEQTTCITETSEDHPETEMEVEKEVMEVEGKEEEEAVSSEAVAMETGDETTVDRDVKDRMTKAIAAMDEAATSKSKKKASSTSDKVRTMLMKSKAKGDKKRVPKVEDRFFLELVVVEDDGDGKCAACVSPVFLAKTDNVDRILRDCVLVSADCAAAVYVPAEQGNFRVLPTDLSLQDAETKGFLKSFDRAVVRIFK